MVTDRTNDQSNGATPPPGAEEASFLAVADRAVRLFNPDLAQAASAPVPAAYHQFLLGIHQRWLAGALGAGWAAPYEHDVWSLHLREVPILELKRYLYSRGRRTYRGCCKVALAGRADGQYGTLWCSMQYVPSAATRTLEVVVGAEWEAGDFFGARAFSRGTWPDRHLDALRPVLVLLDGVPGLEAAIRTAASLDTTTADEGPDAESRNDEETLAIIDRARAAITGGDGRES
jgi:hypothetical protein